MSFYRVDLNYGYAIFGEHDKEKAFDLFRDEKGIRIIRLKNFMDRDGLLLDGQPEIIDYTQPPTGRN